MTSPYDYTEGYHFLMKHLPTRCVHSPVDLVREWPYGQILILSLDFHCSWIGSFEKNDILRIVRALAIFRPSLIALQMPMTEEDEVFVEKCFQRSLLVSHDGVISFYAI